MLTSRIPVQFRSILISNTNWTNWEQKQQHSTQLALWHSRLNTPRWIEYHVVSSLTHTPLNLNFNILSSVQSISHYPVNKTEKHTVTHWQNKTPFVALACSKDMQSLLILFFMSSLNILYYIMSNSRVSVFLFYLLSVIHLLTYLLRTMRC